MTIISNGGTTRSRRIRVRVALDRAIAAGEGLRLRRGSLDLGTGTVVNPLLWEWVDYVQSTPPGGLESYAARFVPISGQPTDSPAATVTIDDPLRAAVFGIVPSPARATITLVEVETDVESGPQPPTVAYTITDSPSVTPAFTLHAQEVIWIGIRTTQSNRILILDTSLSPPGSDTSLVLYDDQGTFISYDEDGWGMNIGDSSDYRSMLTTPQLDANRTYYLALTQYEPAVRADGWTVETTGTSVFPDVQINVTDGNI